MLPMIIAQVSSSANLEYEQDALASTWNPVRLLVVPHDPIICSSSMRLSHSIFSVGSLSVIEGFGMRWDFYFTWRHLPQPLICSISICFANWHLGWKWVTAGDEDNDFHCSRLDSFSHSFTWYDGRVLFHCQFKYLQCFLSSGFTPFLLVFECVLLRFECVCSLVVGEWSEIIFQSNLDSSSPFSCNHLFSSLRWLLFR